MSNFKFSYDEEFDGLFLYKLGTKSFGSIEVDKIILDFDRKQSLVGLQFISASKVLENVSENKKTEIKKILEKLNRVDVTVEPCENNFLIVSFTLIGTVNGKQKTLSSSLTIPNLKKENSMLAEMAQKARRGEGNWHKLEDV